MREFMLSFFKSNSEISNYMQQTAHLQSPQSRRKAVKVAVIDDQPFAAQMNLQSYGYSTNALGDLKNIEEVKNFHIVLCDVRGVGRHFDPKLEGASIISEIKKNFPEKIVIAYTGGMHNERAIKAAAQRADELVRKDIATEDLVDKLDFFSAQAVNPHAIWNKIRQRFVELDVDSRKILLLEDAYVRSIMEKDPQMEKLQARFSRMNLGQDVRAILQGLVGSAIFSAISGSN